jgi:hypothetical protein
MKIMLFAATVASILPVQAHSWYPMECCSGQDCHEADMVTEMPDGSAKLVEKTHVPRCALPLVLPQVE